jgi:nitrite reductase/ring-hydroxylating ferredoxin subunit
MIWTPVCPFGDLLPERGVAALLGTEQVAVFRLHDDRVRAIGNRDPVCGAQVLSSSAPAATGR